MKRITNLTHSPIQVMVRSKYRSNGSPQMSQLIVPGKGRGSRKNSIDITDEQYTPHIDKLRKDKLISVQDYPDDQ